MKNALNGFGKFSILSAAVMLVAGAAPAQAVINGAGLTIYTGPSARLLDSIGTPEFYSVWYEESCDNPHLRIRANNKPVVMLVVDSTLDANVGLVSFDLKINQANYIFGDGDGGSMDNYTQYIMESMYTSPGVSILSNVLSADKKTLTLNFSGLTAGKKVLFNVDLDAENDPNMFMYPDFRHVLHGAPMFAGAPQTLPASFAAMFASATESLPIVGELTQEDSAPAFSNQNIRPYSVMDKMQILETPGTYEIPEPTSAALAVIVVGAGLLAARHRREVA
ncbi:MAG: hypothetical protein KF688_02375 [Pirellulales bacterium]|nr:hypothetical protein [Pirellulales bacterium]